ncbi:UNVERIFIED_CONTAM: hypothetical protein Cloal_0208 [Acetivibrio alkalicellulosi]
MIQIKSTIKNSSIKKVLLLIVFYMQIFCSQVFASDIKDSKLVKGTEKLINDITTWLVVLAPVVTGVLIIYFFIRKSAADEMDQKKWDNRIVVAIISCIGAVIASATLNLLIGYYK